MADTPSTSSKPAPLAGRPKRRAQPVAEIDDAAFAAKVQAVNAKLGMAAAPPSPDAGQGTTSGGTPIESDGRDREPLKLTIVLPAYIHDAMEDWCREQGKRRWTKRYLILHALAELGLDIAASDMVEDGRRRRGKTRPSA